MSSTQKAVLMCIADHANDQGLAWPSIPGICEWTCLSRTAVIEAMKWLENQGCLTIEKVVGRNNRCTVNVSEAEESPSQPVRQTDPHPSASRTGQEAEPVRQPDPPGAPDGPPPVRQTDPTRPAGAPEPSINHQSTINEPQEKTREGDLFGGLLVEVSEQVLADYRKVRKTKKAGDLTKTAIEGIAREAEKAGVTLEAALRMCCERSWVGFKAEWATSATSGTESDWRRAQRERVQQAAPYAAARKEPAGETAYQRQMRERMQRDFPSIAAQPPGARREIFDLETAGPVRIDKHRGFAERDYKGNSDGSIPS